MRPVRHGGGAPEVDPELLSGAQRDLDDRPPLPHRLLVERLDPLDDSSNELVVLAASQRLLLAHVLPMEAW